MLQKILSARRITLPKDFCIKHNLKQGDYVDVSANNSSVTVNTVKIEAKKI